MYLCQYDFVKQNYIRYDRDTDDDATRIECIKTNYNLDNHVIPIRIEK